MRIFLWYGSVFHPREDEKEFNADTASPQFQHHFQLMKDNLKYIGGDQYIGDCSCLKPVLISPSIRIADPAVWKRLSSITAHLAVDRSMPRARFFVVLVQFGTSNFRNPGHVFETIPITFPQAFSKRSISVLPILAGAKSLLHPWFPVASVWD